MQTRDMPTTQIEDRPTVIPRITTTIVSTVDSLQQRETLRPDGGVRDIPVMCNYFCAKHGKAEADGTIGHLSMHLDAVVRSGSQEFSDAGEIVCYCNLKLQVCNPDDAMCCHWQ